MKIALFSFEYPPETAHGGIATCMRQTADMMLGLGHHVEVFAGSYTADSSGLEEGVTVHRIKHDEHETFHQAIVPGFVERHAAVGFDLLESPELMIEAAGVVGRVPEIARVVKVHSPNAFLLEATHGQYQPPGLIERARLHLDAMRQGEKPYWAGAGMATPVSADNASMNKAEREFATSADALITPSCHMVSRLTEQWGIDSQHIVNVPNVYVPGTEMQSGPIDNGNNLVITIGRLEPLKGVFDLARAIPLILNKRPETRFRLVGESQQSDLFGDVGHYLKRTLLRRHLARVELTGPLPVDQIPAQLDEADICVLPSILDNFPYACLEAMAAGRAVVGTRGTGMAEMIEDGRTGLLVDQKTPEQIASAVIHLLDNPDERQALGDAAREHVLEAYSPARLGPMQEKVYADALARRDQRVTQSASRSLARDA